MGITIGWRGDSARPSALAVAVLAADLNALVDRMEVDLHEGTVDQKIAEEIRSLRQRAERLFRQPDYSMSR